MTTRHLRATWYFIKRFHKLLLILVALAVSIFFFVSSRVEADSILAGFALDDSGIQTFNQDYVPQVSATGRVRYTLKSDSFFPLILNLIDVGPVWDENGQPQGTMWNKYNLNGKQSRNALPQIKAAGFNTVWTGFPPNKYELRLFNQYGLKIFPALDLARAWAERNWQLVTNQVNAMKDDPSMLGWYLFDQRDDIGGAFGADRISDMNYVYQAIKSVDPYRFIFPNLAGPQTGSPTCQYHTFSDIFSLDELWTLDYFSDLRYILNGSKVNDCFKAQPGYETYQRKPLFLTVQAFRHSDRAPIVPSSAQIRAEMYSAITAGATGIQIYYLHTPWAWGNGKISYNQDDTRPTGFSAVSPEVNSAQWDTIAFTNKEIEKYKKVFLSPTSTDVYHVYNRNGTVLTMLKDTTLAGEPGRYLLAVNSENKLKTMLFQVPGYNNVVSVLDNRTLAPQNINGNFGFTDSFEPYGVRLYKIQNVDAPPVVNYFTSSLRTIAAGQSTNLFWSVGGANTISISPSVGTVTGTSISVTPSQTTTYTLTATNAGGSTTQTTTITVLQP